MHVDVSTNETIAQQFARDGFVLCESVIAKNQLDTICFDANQIEVAAGTRNLLEFGWCRELLATLRRHPEISQLLAPTLVAVQCTLFEKVQERNWLVGLHQDLSIPVRERIEHPTLLGWSQKEGRWFVQVPPDVLDQLVAVRVHLDDCGVDDGPLRVVPGSHQRCKMSNDESMVVRDQLGERICVANAGDAFVMRPLLLHASSKSHGSGRRRVLHFTFGPPDLPFGLAWRDEI